MMFPLLIIIIEFAIFIYVCRRQYQNWNGAQKALAEISSVVNLTKFNPKLVHVSDTLLNQFDRKIESPLNKIQSFSNASLVTGIGGTMALFVFEAVLVGHYIDQDVFPLWAILPGFLLALFSSLSGVILHLRITSIILSTAYKEISAKEDEIMDAHALVEPETELSEQLEELMKAWSEADATDLFEMIPHFLEGQTKVMQRMQDNFANQQSTTREVIRSQKDLIHKVDIILTELKEGHQAHEITTTEILKSLEHHIETVSEIHDKLVNERQLLTSEIKSLPENIKSALDVETIDQIFGSEVRNAIAEMKKEFLKVLKDFETKIDNYQRELISQLSGQNSELIKSFNDLKGEMINSVIDPLLGIADQLDKTVRAMPKFGDDLQKSVEAISGIPEKLEETGKNINEIISSIATETLSPVSEKMAQYIDTVRETHQAIEKIIQGLVSLIQDMVHEIEGK